jgi:hypothetical protein
VRAAAAHPTRRRRGRRGLRLPLAPASTARRPRGTTTAAATAGAPRAPGDVARAVHAADARDARAHRRARAAARATDRRRHRPPRRGRPRRVCRRSSPVAQCSPFLTFCSRLARRHPCRSCSARSSASSCPTATGSPDAMATSVTITGADVAQRRLRAIGATQASSARRSSASRATRSDAFAACPSIRAVSQRSVHGGKDSVRKVSDRGYVIGTSVPYARFVFGGTKTMPARPPTSRVISGDAPRRRLPATSSAHELVTSYARHALRER